MRDTNLIEELNGLIADATVLYQKLRHYHWNVCGPGFFVLHEKFEALYTAWADAIDDLAERVRTLGGVPVHTLAGVLRLAMLEEDDAVPEAAEMVRRVAGDLERLHARVSDVMDGAEATSRGTADLLGRMLDHVEKDLWMLGAWLHQDDVPHPTTTFEDETALSGANAGAAEVPAGANEQRRPYMQPD